MQLTAEDLLQSIWAALRRIEDNMALPPAPLEPPLINIAPPDLADVVTAVTSLKPGPTAQEIAAAIAGVLGPNDPQPGGSAALDAVAAALEKLDFRLKGMGVQAYGGGSVNLSAADIAAISGLTDTQLRAAPVPVSGAFFQTTQPVSNTYLSNQTGTWAYYAGASGTVNVTAGQRVLGIAAHSTAGGSMTINGGTAAPVPANSGLAVVPAGNLVAPTLVFTSTDSYFVEVVS